MLEQLKKENEKLINDKAKLNAKIEKMVLEETLATMKCKQLEKKLAKLKKIIER